MMTKEQIDLLILNKIIPAGCPQAQIDFFATTCEKKKLDPVLKQIHLVERKSKDHFGKWVASYTIQAGIDGMRVIAQRNCKIISYKRWTEKREDDLYGICEISTEDRGIYKDELPFNEYAQRKTDGTINHFWKQFPQTMLKKCAEESVLRMMAPEDLSGVYGDDEMLQADNETAKPKELENPKEIPVETIRDLKKEWTECKKLVDASKLWGSCNESEKKAYRYIKEETKLRIRKADIEKEITKLTIKNYQQNYSNIYEVIDSSKGEEKKKLIELYNDKLTEIGIDEPYESLPFDNEPQPESE